MPLPASSKLSDDDVYAITGKGDAELKAPGTQLTAADLQALVLIDGFSTIAQIAQRVPNLSREDIHLSLRKLAAGKLIVSTVEPDSDVMGSGFSTISVPAGFFSSLTAETTAEAEGGTSILKKKGYYVRIAKRVDKREVKDGWKPTIMVVDDDPDLQKLIRTYFVMEGFNVRAAHKRDEIMIALR